MTTVYVVTAGSYSDYHIFGIYSTREIAETYQKSIGDANDIEEYELDSMRVSRIEKGEQYYRVEMFAKDAKVTHIRMCDPLDWHDEERKRHISIYPNGLWRNQTEIYFEHWAKSEEHAVKIASEIRAQLVARGVIENLESQNVSAYFSEDGGWKLDKEAE